MTNEQSKGQATEYVVLKLVEAEDDQASWDEVDTVVASNPKAAIKAATPGGGTFVAVPARSFKPTTRGQDTITRDVWS